MSTTVIPGSRATAVPPAVYVRAPDVTTSGGTFVEMGGAATVTTTTPAEPKVPSVTTAIDTVFTPTAAVEANVTDRSAAW